jgi:hypothetical protein
VSQDSTAEYLQNIKIAEQAKNLEMLNVTGSELMGEFKSKRPSSRHSEISADSIMSMGIDKS